MLHDGQSTGIFTGRQPARKRRCTPNNSLDLESCLVVGRALLGVVGSPVPMDDPFNSKQCHTTKQGHPATSCSAARSLRSRSSAAGWSKKTSRSSTSCRRRSTSVRWQLAAESRPTTSSTTCWAGRTTSDPRVSSGTGRRLGGSRPIDRGSRTLSREGGSGGRTGSAIRPNERGKMLGHLHRPDQQLEWDLLLCLDVLYRVGANSRRHCQQP